MENLEKQAAVNTDLAWTDMQIRMKALDMALTFNKAILETQKDKVFDQNLDLALLKSAFAFTEFLKSGKI